MVVGMAGAGVVALLHTQVGDALGFPLYVGGICFSFAGLGVFGAGPVGLVRAMLLLQRQERDRVTGQAPPAAS